jgi:hypothetical protein
VGISIETFTMERACSSCAGSVASGARYADPVAATQLERKSGDASKDSDGDLCYRPHENSFFAPPAEGKSEGIGCDRSDANGAKGNRTSRIATQPRRGDENPSTYRYRRAQAAECASNQRA